MDQIIAVLVGLLGVPLIQALKKQFKLQDEWALVLTAGVSVVIALLALFVTGQVTMEQFTFENASHVFEGVMLTAMIVYRMLIKPAEAK